MTLLLGEGGGRFSLGPALATGGQGIVYAAADERDGSEVVVKVALAPGDPTIRAAALRQAALAEDPQVGRHLVPVWDVGTWDDRPFAVFARLPCTLEAYLARGGSAARAARALLEAADALGRAGVAHGDLKPSNVFVVDDGESAAVLLGDLWSGVGPPPVSPGFSAPEAWAGAPPSRRADRYALGATLAAAFCGGPPACAASPARPPTSAELAAVPPPLVPSVRRLLDPRPRRRPDPAAVLAAWDHPRRPRPGPRLAALALAVFGALAWWRTPSGSPAPPPCPRPFAPSDGRCQAPDGRAVAWAPPGAFAAGAEGPLARWAVDAFPVDVQISRGFWVRTTEVTQREARALLGEDLVARGSERLPDGQWRACRAWEGHDTLGDDLPVACISWWDAVRLANAASRADGLAPVYRLDDALSVVWDRAADGWRLPTEAEWEWAARGGPAARPWAGAPDRDAICGHANVRDADAPEAWGNEVPCHDGAPVLGRVGGRQPNALGVYDMLGNVAEWTWDRWADRPAAGAERLVDPRGPEVGLYRVYRGGGWNQIARPVSARYASPPDDRGLNIGVRLVRDAAPGQNPRYSSSWSVSWWSAGRVFTSPVLGSW